MTISIIPNERTQATPFNRIPADNNKPLLQVAEGVDSWFAISMADALTESATALVHKSISDAEGMDGHAASLCVLALETAQALRAPAGVEA